MNWICTDQKFLLQIQLSVSCSQDFKKTGLQQQIEDDTFEKTSTHEAQTDQQAAQFLVQCCKSFDFYYLGILNLQTVQDCQLNFMF